MAIQAPIPEGKVKEVLDSEVNLRPVIDSLPFSRFLRILGPGVITGAADDDPSGIATYSQAGAQFGYGLNWLMLFTLPLMTAVQEACARIGAVTGKGLAAVIRQHYPKRVLFPLVVLVILANTINIGADIGAMAAAAQLLLPQAPFFILTILFALLAVALQIFVPYKKYVSMLKWLAIMLLAYFVTAFITNPNWVEVGKATVIPHIELNKDFIFMIVAVLGTTISPYLFFWQTSEVVEEEIASHRLAQRGGIPRLSKPYVRNLRLDNAVGMIFSSVTALFIMIATATVLHAHGISNINSAADAAKALEPLVQGVPHAGFIAKAIFTVGIIGLGLLAVPVLAGSSAYAFSEIVDWQEGLFRKFAKARGFYGVITVVTLTGLLINFSPLDPIKALIYAAVINGMAAIPLLFIIARVGRRSDIMGEYRTGWLAQSLIWLTFVVMSVATIAMLAPMVATIGR
jgi:NRAMP (natural resistance-associated macrophage protein)-like metal ion transporter